MSVRVRAMNLEDLPRVLVLERALFPEDAWSAEMFRAEVVDPTGTRHYLVAEDDEEVIGYAGLAAAGGQGDVQTVAVRPDRWGRGVGSRLVAELVTAAAERGCDEVFLDVRADNERARRLYERFGFVRIGVRRRYYQPSGVDAVVMCRRDGRTVGTGGEGVNHE